MSEIIIPQFLQYTQQSCQLGFEGSYLIIMTKETAISFETRGFWKILWNEVMDMECRKYDLLTLGEVLLRLSPPANERMIRTPMFEQNIGGAELNVAVDAAQLGLKTGMIGKISSNDIGRLARNEIHGQFPEEIFTSARCFHTCGITLALDEKVRGTAVTLMRKFKEHGTLISFDVNFRGNLWSV